MHHIALSILLLLVLAHNSWPIDPGTANGTLTVGTDQIVLTHSHAFHDDNMAGLLPGPELRIVLTEQELPPELLPEARTARLDRLVQAGKVRGVLLLVDPRHPTRAVRGRLLYPPEAPGEAFVTFTLQGQELSKLQISNVRVSGVSQHRGALSPTLSFAYTVSFSAPRFRYDPARVKLTGPHAMHSPPAQAWLAFVRACQAGDWHTVQSLVTPGRWQVVETRRGQEREAIVCQQQPHDRVAGVDQQRQIQRVIVRNVWALLVLRDRTVIVLRQRAGAWQID